MSSKEYVAGRVQAALAEAKGSTAAAQRMLLAECARDGRLLRGLAAPYLQGIIAHAVGQTTTRQPQSATPSNGLAADALESVLSQLGKTIGEATLPRGMTALTEQPSRPAAGPGHQDAIRQMVDSYKRKRPAQ